MINFENYTRNTYEHVPEGYQEHTGTLNQIIDANNGSASGCVIDGWKLGYERAYRAAKSKRLDFQQEARNNEPV